MEVSMIYLLLYFVLFFAWMLIMIKIAPSGYEDKNGFHYLKSGRKKLNANIKPALKRRSPISNPEKLAS